MREPHRVGFAVEVLVLPSVLVPSRSAAPNRHRDNHRLMEIVHPQALN